MYYGVSTCISQIAELCHEIEDRDDALAKAREAAHKAQLQKYQVCLLVVLHRTYASELLSLKVVE